MWYMDDTNIIWGESYLDKYGHKEIRYHREGYPAMISGTNLNKLADHTVTECGPAPSKDGTPVWVRSIIYYNHGSMHRDDGPSYTDSNCTCSTGSCKCTCTCTKVREWCQYGKFRTDGPCRVTYDKQAWVPRAYRPATVHRDGRLGWSSSVPERYTYWVHTGYARPVRRRFRAIVAASSVSGLANLVTWWVDG
jgi:hypothetical protein